MGSLRAEKRPNGRWRIINQVFVEGRRKSVIVSKEVYMALGINPDWTWEEARGRCSQINSQTHLEAVAVASKRALNFMRVTSTYLPDEFVIGFEDILRRRDDKEKSVFHWSFVQTMIVELQLDSSNFASECDQIYDYYKSKCISYSYVEKVTHMLNLWGKFIARNRKSFYEPVKNPRGRIAQKIKESQRKAKPTRGPSEPLTPQMLAAIRLKLPAIEQYNWLGCSVWFGLRPEEIDLHKCEVEIQGDVTIVWVYQPKLENLDEELRWKPLPVLYEEQKKFLPLLLDGLVERPLNKVLKRLTGKRTTSYAGRKGFTDLMMDLGQRFEDISIWLGHKSIQRTWNNYKDRQRVRFVKPKRSA